jgi:5-methylcytosine-specific restriction protein A
MSVLTYCHRCEGLKPRPHKHRVKDTRPGARQRGYDWEWQQTRRKYLAAFPICQHPEGCISLATEVHHIDGQGPKGERGHDWSNLSGLCASHHSQTTATEQPGGFNAA